MCVTQEQQKKRCIHKGCANGAMNGGLCKHQISNATEQLPLFSPYFQETDNEHCFYAKENRNSVVWSFEEFVTRVCPPADSAASTELL